MREGMSKASLIVTAIAACAGIISAVYLFVPVGGADDLSIGNYRIRADFPCLAKRLKQVIGTTETGDELSQTSLMCSQGDVTYSLSAAEYSEHVLKSLPADVWLNRSLDSVRSQPHYTLNSSTRLSHQTFPAIRMHFSDSTVPPLDMARLSVLTDAGFVVIGATWPSGSPQPPSATGFTNSLSIELVKN